MERGGITAAHNGLDAWPTKCTHPLHAAPLLLPAPHSMRGYVDSRHATTRWATTGTPTMAQMAPVASAVATPLAAAPP